MAGQVAKYTGWLVMISVGFTLVHLATLAAFPQPLDYLNMFAFMAIFVAAVQLVLWVSSKLNKPNPPRD